MVKNLKPNNTPITPKSRYSLSIRIIAHALTIVLCFGVIFAGINNWDIFGVTSPTPFSGVGTPSWGSPELPAWHNPYQHRPFGRVHDFGLLVLGDMTVGYGRGINQWQSISHGEVGAAIMGDLNFYRARDYIDFGKAHEPFNAQLPMSHPIPRLMVGGNIWAQESGETYASILLHGGDILMTQGASLSNIWRIDVAIGNSTYTYGIDSGWTFVGDYSTVSRINSTTMQGFFNNARNSLTSLSDSFAAGAVPWGIDDGVTIRAANVHYMSSNILTGNLDYRMGDWPANWDTFDVLIFDLAVNYTSGIYDYAEVITPNIYFPPNFDGLLVFNVPNTGGPTYAPMRFDNDTNILNNVTWPGLDASQNHHALGRHFSNRIIWNFTGSNDIYHEMPNGGGYAVIGGILAPRSTFNAAYGGYVKGPLVVQNFNHSGGGFEIHTPIIPPVFPGIVPEPPMPSTPTTPPTQTTPTTNGTTSTTNGTTSTTNGATGTTSGATSTTTNGTTSTTNGTTTTTINGTTTTTNGTEETTTTTTTAPPATTAPTTTEPNTQEPTTQPPTTTPTTTDATTTTAATEPETTAPTTTEPNTQEPTTTPITTETTTTNEPETTIPTTTAPPTTGGTDPNIPPIPQEPGNELIEDPPYFWELDDEGAPLGRWEWDENEEMWIFDEDVPLSYFPSSPLLPQTGIAGTPIYVYLMLIVASAVAVVTTVKLVQIIKLKTRQ